MDDGTERVCKSTAARRRSAGPSKWATRWIVGGVAAVRCCWALAASSTRSLNAATEVEVQRVRAIGGRRGAPEGVVLNATGYIVAAHKIELAAKVIGKVAWIGVEKGDRVKQGQVLVRLEDDEYRAQLQQAKGKLANLQAQLAEAGARLAAGGDRAGAGQSERGASADLENARVTLERTRKLVTRRRAVASRALDDAQARYDSARGQSEFAAEGLRPGEARPAAGTDRRHARPGGAGQGRGGLRANAISTTPSSARRSPARFWSAPWRRANSSPPASSATAAPRATWCRWPI